MSPRKALEGRFEVTGPGHDAKLVPDVGTGLSTAQGWACEHLGELDDERTFYVTALGGDPQARVTLEADGSVKTVLL